MTGESAHPTTWASGNNSLGRATTPTHFPLLSHRSLDAVFAYQHDKPLSVAHYLSDVRRVAATLAPAGYVVITCQNRYFFAVSLAAALLTRNISLMPSTLTPEVLQQLESIAPNARMIADADVARLLADNEPTSTHDAMAIPEIPAAQPVAWVFTSGSTGTPIPHVKTWGSLVKNVRVEAQRLGMTDGRSHTIIGTVPPQHMYGFESTVLVAMQSGCALCAERPFYPADICSTLAAIPRPRLLVTTPFHLHALLAAEIEIPPFDLVVSATAPLSPELAQQSETRLHIPIIEIYGCTETGQVATRYPTRSQEWQLFDGVHFNVENGQIWAAGGHVEKMVAMQDELELRGDDRFVLHGRSADMVNIAGKRSSLAYLTNQLKDIPGVIDAVFFMPDEANIDRVTRLAAFVVAPTLDVATVTKALRSRVDPVFLPRPIYFIDALPRTATGKLPRQALTALLALHSKKV